MFRMFQLFRKFRDYMIGCLSWNLFWLVTFHLEFLSEVQQLFPFHMCAYLKVTRRSLRSSFESNFYLKLVTLASNTLLLAAQVYVPYRAISRTGLNPALAAWARALLTTVDSNDQSLTHPYFSVFVVVKVLIPTKLRIELKSVLFPQHLYTK